MSISIAKILDAIGNHQFQGDQNYLIEAPATLGDAGPTHISFFGQIKYKEQAAASKAGCLIVEDGFKNQLDGYEGLRIYVPKAVPAWRLVLKLWENDLVDQPWGIDPAARVSRTARLGKNVSIGALAFVDDRVIVGDGTVIHPQCYIGKSVSIGKDCVIYPGVVIRERCVIGDRAIIHPGAVIGADGFGFVTIDGKHEKIPQIGTVEIANDVEIGANCTIDRGTVGPTRIGEGSKFDNAVHIAHNVVVGRGCLFAAQVGIAGSTTIGDYVIFGGQVGVADHVEVAEGTIVGGQSGIIGSIKKKDILWGTPARNHREALKLQALYSRLPEIIEIVKRMGERDPQRHG
ncbi:MAG: UDP-3-O-(3-hydroxymyristoyl)glucosamine N-acyltransferase [Elusimicrobiota bacterium]